MRVVGLLLVGTAIDRGIEFVTRVVVARWFGSAALGTYAVVTAIVEIAGLVAVLGLTHKIVATHSAEKVEHGVLSASALLVALAAVIAAAIVWVAVLLGLLPSLAHVPVVLIAAAILTMGWARLGLAFAQAMRAWVAKVVVDDSVLPVVRALVLWPLAASGVVMSAAALAGTAAAATIATAVLLVWRGIGGRMRERLADPVRAARLRELLAFGIPLGLAALLDLLIGSLDLLMLQRVATAETVGVYAAAVTLGRIPFPFYAAAAYAYIPAFAASLLTDPAHPAPVHADEQRLFRLGTAALAGALAFAAPELTALVFGKDFGGATGPTIVLLAGVMTWSGLGFNTYHLTLSGHTLLYAATRILTVSLALVLYIALIPRLGALGAALASTLVWCFAAGSTSYLSARLLGTRSTAAVTLAYLMPIGIAYLMSGDDLVLRLPTLAVVFVYDLLCWRFDRGQLASRADTAV